MTFVQSQEATQANLTFTNDTLIDIEELRDHALEALAPFGLMLGDGSDIAFDRATINSGAIILTLNIDDGTAPDEMGRISISVEKQRGSETLHPNAHVAILAEVTSILIERVGGDHVTWGPEAVAIPADRFHAAFKPMRQRCADDVPHITPRRIRPANAPEAPAQPAPCDLPPAAAMDQSDLNAIFRAEPLEDASPQQNSTTRAATLATTASVAVMMPTIGVPLAVYQAVKGGDIRVSTQAFALSAVLTGMLPSMSYLPFF